VTDKYEGLITVNIATLGDGNPDNNFFTRGATYNPEGVLNGASTSRSSELAYIAWRYRTVVVDVTDPLHPQLVGQLGAPYISKPRAIAAQFRYASWSMSKALRCSTSPTSSIRALQPRGIYRSSTHATNLCSQDLRLRRGRQAGSGDRRCDSPRASAKIDQVYNAGGSINDLNDVKLGMTDASLFRVPRRRPQRPESRANDLTRNSGLSRLLAAPDAGHGREVQDSWTRASRLAKGLDRDRAVDESGNQLVVFGRLGARPFTKPEMEKLYLRDGEVYTVSDTPPSEGDLAHKEK